MNTSTRQRWSQFYRTFQEPRSYTKVLELERTFTRKGIEYVCEFECSVRLWENHEKEPSIDCVSSVEAWYFNGQPVGHESILDDLDIMAQQYALTHIEELLELIEKASKE